MRWENQNNVFLYGEITQEKPLDDSQPELHRLAETPAIPLVWLRNVKK